MGDRKRIFKVLLCYLLQQQQRNIDPNIPPSDIVDFLTGLKCKYSWNIYMVSERALKSAWNHNPKVALLSANLPRTVMIPDHLEMLFHRRNSICWWLALCFLFTNRKLGEKTPKPRQPFQQNYLYTLKQLLIHKKEYFLTWMPFCATDLTEIILLSNVERNSIILSRESSSNLVIKYGYLAKLISMRCWG